MKNDYIRLARTVTWEMAHVLKDHPGKCRFLHGHTYRLTAEIGGYVKENGMVTDFANLKNILQERIVALFDHALVVDRDMAEQLPFIFTDQHARLITLNNPPTCENLLLMIRNKLSDNLPEGITLEQIILNETQNSCAKWVRSDTKPGTGE